jgi:hypothetical protein
LYEAHFFRYRENFASSRIYLEEDVTEDITYGVIFRLLIDINYKSELILDIKMSRIQFAQTKVEKLK